MKPITTTLNAIREHLPCLDGWEKLLKHLGKTKADDEPLKFSTIAESNGINEALRYLTSLESDYYPMIRRLAADYAESVLHLYEKEYPNDDVPRKAIQAARDFTYGKIIFCQLADAADAAWDAADDAADAARIYTSAAWAAKTAWAAAWHAGHAGYVAQHTGRFVMVTWYATGFCSDTVQDSKLKLQTDLLIKYFG